MKNFLQPGNVVTISAPRALTAGDGVVKGKLFGVSANTVASGAPAEVGIEGVYAFKRAGGVTMNEGDAVTFDEVTQTIVAGGTAGAKVIGICVEAVAPDDAAWSLVKLIPNPA